MINVILSLSYLCACIFSGLFLLEKSGFGHLKTLTKITASFVIGAMLEMFVAHCLAFFFQSFKVSTYVTIIVLLAVLAVTRNINFKTLFKYDGGLLNGLTAIALALIYGIRDYIYGTPDRVHNASFACIANNGTYPPSSPIALDLKFSDYHYGTDLMGATLKIVTGFAAWDAQSLQIGLWVAIFFIICVAFIEYFVGSSLLSYFGAIIVSTYTSIASYMFLYLELSKNNASSFERFFVDWVIMSWTSISSVNAQLRLTSQNIALGLILLLLFIIVNLLDQEISKKSLSNFFTYTTIFLLTFGLYFIYPTVYYPLVVALGALVVFYLLKILISKKQSLDSIKKLLTIIAIFLVARIFTFCNSPDSIDGAATLIFKPHLDWVNWGKAYIFYFLSLDEIRNTALSFDPVLEVDLASIPLISFISFLDFGDIMIPTTIIFFYLLIKNNFYFKQKLESLLLLPITSFISFSVCFFVILIIRPIEMTRFILWAKIFALLFLVIVVMRFMNTSGIPWYLRSKNLFAKIAVLIAIFVFTLGLIPGIAAMYPHNKMNFFDKKSLNEQEDRLIRDLEKIHKPYDVVLDSRLYDIGVTFSGLAGYYSIGGQPYKEDTTTRRTALKLMSPRLLDELWVSYVLLDPKYKLTELAAKRLADPDLFIEISDIAKKYPGYHFYKYKSPAKTIIEAKEPVQEYLWTIGYQKNRGFLQANGADNKPVYAKSKSSLKQTTIEFKKLYAPDQPLVAVWLKAQALPLNRLKLDR